MDGEDGDKEIMGVLRAQAKRFAQTVIAGLAIVSIAAALAVHHYAPELGLADTEPEAIARCFLSMGISYIATLLVWDWLFAESRERE